MLSISTRHTDMAACKPLALRLYAAFAALVTAAATVAGDGSNIAPAHKFAWGENIGWTNWRDAGTPSGQQGVFVGESVFSGFIWAENAGWINVGDGTPADGMRYGNVDGADLGVNIDAAGRLFGLAWGENIGWINFEAGTAAKPPIPARLEGGRLRGFVWGENVGWINLDDAEHYVGLTCQGCDANCDGSVNQFDIQAFVDLMIGSTACSSCAGDTNGDGSVNQFDIQAFVDCLAG